MTRRVPWLGVASLWLLGCVGQGSATWTSVDIHSGKTIRLTPKPLPEGECFSGTYSSPHLGLVNLVETRGPETKSRMSGSFAREDAAGLVIGGLRGTIAGNFAEVEWVERREATGALLRSGTGFLYYRPGTDGEPDAVYGKRRANIFYKGGLGPRIQVLEEVWTARRETTASCTPEIVQP